MASKKIFHFDSVITDNRFLELGFDLVSDGDRISEAVPHFDKERALAYLREHPDVMAAFLSQTGTGTVYWAGSQSASMTEDGRSAGVRLVMRSGGQEAVGDNVFGAYLEDLRNTLRRQLDDYLVEEVSVPDDQVTVDFLRKGAYASDIELLERDGESFIHVDSYRPAKFRFDTGLDGTTGHAKRSVENDVPFHTFVCPFGTSYPAPVIVGSAAEASMLYEQALRGELDWKALFKSLRERGLLDSKLTGRQIDNLISDYRSQFEWMRDEIVNNPSLRDMKIVASSLMVPDASMGRTVFDARQAPSPAHVLARYINNPLLLFSGGENGVARALASVDKGNPERFSMTSENNEGFSLLVAGSDTIGGREPGRKATTRTVRNVSVDEAGRRVFTNERRAEIPMKGKEAIDADYAAFSSRMDDIIAGISEDTPVRFVTGNASSMGNTVGIGTPRMLERYVKEHGGNVMKYDFIRQMPVVAKEGEGEGRLSVVMMDHFADCLPVLVGKEDKVSFLLNPNDDDSSVLFTGAGLRPSDGAICFSSSEDLNVRNVLSIGSLAASAGLPVVHSYNNLSVEDQRRVLEEGALISLSGLHSEVRYDGSLFKGELRKQWQLDGVNHLSQVDSATGLSFPLVAQMQASPVLVEGYPFRSVLGAYMAEVCSSLAISDKDTMQAIGAAEGSVSELMKVYRENILRDRDTTDGLLSDAEQEGCIRRAIRKMSEANSSFSESLMDLDGRDVVFSSTSGDRTLFVDMTGAGENRFGLAFAAERDWAKDMYEARRLSEIQERERLLDTAAKRQKLATGSRAEGQKVIGGLPKSIDAAKDAIWFIGTHNPLELSLGDEMSSFEMWDDLNGEDPLVREKVARPYVDSGDGERMDNNFVYLFPSDLESFTGRRTIRNLPDSKNLTGVTRVDPATGQSYLAAVGIPVRFNNRGYELMNPDNMPCSYRLDNDSSNFAASIVLSDSKARSIAIKHGLSLCLPGRERPDGSSYYSLGQVFMDKVWSRKDKTMVENPHRSSSNLTLVESYIALLESGKKYPLNCIPLPREKYFTQDDAVVKARVNENQRFISAEGRFIADLMMSLQIANATAVALGVPLRFPLDKDGRIDLGPGVPEEYRMMAEERINSFIGVTKAEEQIQGALPLIERIPLHETGKVHDFLVKSGTDLYIHPNDLVVAFGPYDFDSVINGYASSLHKMAFRMEDGTVFTVSNSKTTKGADPDLIDKYLNYSKNDECRFIIRTTNPERTSYFVNSLKAYIDRAKAIKVDVRLITESEMTNGGLEGFVNLLSSNSDQFAESEHDIGREATVFNSSGTVNKDGSLSNRNIDGEDVSGVYWGKVDAKDGFRGYAQLRYTLPDGTQSDWKTITNLELAKDTVMSLVKRTYRSDSFVVPSDSVLELFYKAQAVAFADEKFRSLDWQPNRKVVADDKVIDLGHSDKKAESSLKSVSLSDKAKQGAIVDFNGDYRFLSNFWPCDVVYDGVTYPSVENAFQAAKCADPEGRKAFVEVSASKARELGRSVELRPDWEDVKLDIMEGLVTDKFNRNPEIASRLFDTGSVELIEGNTWNDTFWGVDSNTGMGENHLGEILMDVRESLHLKKGESEDVAPFVSEPEPTISFTESEGGYAKRTYENANAEDVDFTLAVAVDFTTAGERCTAKAAGDSLISVEVEDFSEKSAKKAVKAVLESLPEEFRKGETMGLNIAGNGLYTLFTHGIDQQQTDEFLVRLISGLQSNGVVISSCRTGGQTGVDEAGAAACTALGIPVTVHAPKGWAMRDAGGKDIKDETSFKGRFEKKDLKKLASLAVKAKQIRKSLKQNPS